MRKISLVLVFVVVLSFPVIAAKFATVLHTSDLNEEFDIFGNIATNIGEDRVLEMVIKYNIEFINEQHNRTSLDFLDIRIEGNGETIASRRIDSFSLDLGENRTELVEFEIEKPALIEQISFSTNHTSVVRESGEKVNRTASISISYVPNIPEQKVENLRTNSTEVYRGDRIYLTGSHSNIAFLNISGHIMELERGEIRGWIDIPEDLEVGIQKIPLDIRTGWGNRFQRDIEVKIINRPPNITLNHPEEVEKGKNLPLQVSAVDDMNVTSLVVKFQGKAYTDPNDLKLPTEDLDTGSYRFKATAVDGDGAKTEKNGSFRVVKKLREEKAGDGKNSEDAIDEKDKEEENEDEKKSTGIPVIRQFRKTIQSVIRSIIGLF